MFNYMLYIYTGDTHKTHGVLERMSAELIAIHYVRHEGADQVFVTDNHTGEILREYIKG